ncbi:Ribonuclease VapC [Rhodospirillaceae bacterium LM-1]|nr:Ribonuclease VapC [Rhodospirillaceae bacterium LM-1]
MIVGLDTNFLAYAEGLNDQERQERAISIIDLLMPENVRLPVQALGELHRVLTKKMNLNGSDARAAILRWENLFPTCDTTPSALNSAMDLSADHKFSIWDALILCVAAENGCQILLSEDMQNGFVWRGVTIVNPFALSTHEVAELFH